MMGKIEIEGGRLPDNAFVAPRFWRKVVTTKVYREVMVKEGGRILACGVEWDIVGKNLGGGVWEITLRERDWNDHRPHRA